MTVNERGELDELLKIAEERPCPLTEWERDFVLSLDARRDRPLTPRQGEVFDRLCDKHLLGED